jgi:hypothetical protein
MDSSSFFDNSCLKCGLLLVVSYSEVNIWSVCSTQLLGSKILVRLLYSVTPKSTRLLQRVLGYSEVNVWSVCSTQLFHVLLSHCEVESWSVCSPQLLRSKYVFCL